MVSIKVERGNLSKSTHTDYRFPDGSYLIRDNQLIDPRSHEGRALANILNKKDTDERARALHEQVFSNIVQTADAEEAQQLTGVTLSSTTAGYVSAGGLGVAIDTSRTTTNVSQPSAPPVTQATSATTPPTTTSPEVPTTVSDWQAFQGTSSPSPATTETPVARVKPDDSYRFDNGSFYLHGHQAIHPESAEGKTISRILQQQRETRELNARQKEYFWKITRAKNAEEAFEIMQRHAAGAGAASGEDNNYRLEMEQFAGKKFIGPMGRQAILAEMRSIEISRFRKPGAEERYAELQRLLDSVEQEGSAVNESKNPVPWLPIKA